MGFFDWLFGKKRLEKFEEEVKNSFSNVKKDVHKISKWLAHFNERHKDHEENFSKLLSRIEKIEKDLEEIRNFVNFFVSGSGETLKKLSKRLSKQLSKQGFKQPQTAVQTGVVQTAVQTPVQTAVQTGFQTTALKGLTTMERVVLLVLLNSKEKLSYEDIAVLVGKDKSTVRGQINSIKQKSEGLISEVVESDGKKRFFIEENLKERILDEIILSKKRAKKRKVRV